MSAEVIDFAERAPAARRRRDARELTASPIIVAVVCCFMPLAVAYAIGLSLLDQVAGGQRR